MPEYRRYYQPGGTFFFTVVTEARAPILCTDRARTLLRSAIHETRDRFPFTVDAFVLLPDHLHTIWTLPEADRDFSKRWSMIKRLFSKAWMSAGEQTQPVSSSRNRNRRLGVWQRRFWEHLIRDEADFERHCDYIHYNPVKHDRASCPHLWPHSTFHRFVEAGFYELYWCCACDGRMQRKPDFEGLRATAME